MEIAIGARIAKVARAKRISRIELSRGVGVYPHTVVRQKKAQSLQVDVLARYSQVLEHNFFADLAVQLPDSYTTDIPADISKDEEIKRLKHRIEILEAQLEVLRK